MTGKIKQMRNRRLGNGKRRAWTMFTALIVTCAVLLAGMLTPPLTANAALSAGESVYLAVGKEIGYGGTNTTHIFKADGNEAYCVEPSKKNPSSGTYEIVSLDSLDNVSDKNKSILRSIFYYGYGGPGFDKTMNWPDEWWDGETLKTERYLSITHLVSSYAYQDSLDDALWGTNTTFRTWFNNDVMSTHGIYQQMKSLADEVPDSFQVFAILPSNNTTQVIMFGEDVPTGHAQVIKESSDEGLTFGLGTYSLEGAEFTFYDGDDNVAGKVTTYANGESSTLALEAGVYTVKETKAPEGYLLNEETQTVTIVKDKTSVVTFQDTPAYDSVSLLVDKTSVETGDHDAQGDAQLANAEFTIEYYDTLDYDDYDSLTAAGLEPTRSWAVATDEDGEAYLSDDYLVSGDAFYYVDGQPVIPRGTIVVYESKAPEGYALNDTVNFQKIQENADSSTDITYNTAEYPEQVYRGDLHFTKKDGDTAEVMANVAFSLTSTTTGESHVIVTDENGYFNSSAECNKHTANTNGNDWALAADDVIDSDELDNQAGIWFSGTASAAVDANDSLGALPYDTYVLKELRCTNNVGYSLIEATVTVSRDGVNIDYGTLDDPVISIGTTALDVADSDNYVGVGAVSIVDTIKYSGLIAGTEYTFVGQLFNAETGEAIVVDGETVTASTTFTPDRSYGEQTVTFEFNSYDLQGVTVVVHETLYQDGLIAAEHADDTDINQQVTVETVEIGTTALDGVDGDKNVVKDTEVVIVDTVSYTGLVPGSTYTVTGVLYDKNTGDALLDADGDEITASAEFTAEHSSGTVDVTFTFDATLLEDVDEIVVFESLYYGDRELAVHADIEDEGQTVTLTPPEIGTSAADGVDGDDTVSADSTVTIVDTVVYENLVPGKEYTVTGTLMDKSTGEAFVVDGEMVTSTVTFTPESSSGTVDVTFTFDASGITEDTELVAFESLERDGVEVAVHADINDGNQTVTVVPPSIGTSASDGTDDSEGLEDHTVTASRNTIITDTVSYDGLVPGKEYVLRATLMDKSTSEALTVNGDTVTAQITFTPEYSSGSVNIDLGPFDATGLAGHDLVVFEHLYDGDSDGEETLVAEHTDINDEMQTVNVEDADSGAGDAADGPLAQTGAAIGATLAVALLLAAGGLFLMLRKRSRDEDLVTSTGEEV